MNVETLLPTARGRLIIINETAPLTEAAACLGSGHTNLVVVCDDAGAMVGIVSKTDIVARISQCAGCSCTEKVAHVMTREVAYCHPGDALQHAWSLMKEKGVLHIPIVDHNHQPLGVLNARDALQALLGEVEYEESLLRDYVMGIGYH